MRFAGCDGVVGGKEIGWDWRGDEDMERRNEGRKRRERLGEGMVGWDCLSRSVVVRIEREAGDEVRTTPTGKKRKIFLLNKKKQRTENTGEYTV